jgi:hypothetical protein
MQRSRFYGCAFLLFSKASCDQGNCDIQGVLALGGRSELPQPRRGDQPTQRRLKRIIARHTGSARTTAGREGA